MWIAPDEEGDERVGEAEGGERGGSVAVRAELASVVSAGQRGWQRRCGKSHNLVNERSDDYALRSPLIERKRLLG